MEPLVTDSSNRRNEISESTKPGFKESERILEILIDLPERVAKTSLVVKFSCVVKCVSSLEPDMTILLPKIYTFVFLPVAWNGNKRKPLIFFFA